MDKETSPCVLVCGQNVQHLQPVETRCSERDIKPKNHMNAQEGDSSVARCRASAVIPKPQKGRRADHRHVLLLGKW